MRRIDLASGWTRPSTFVGNPPSIPAEQLPMFPRRLLWEQPWTGSADLHSLGEADDGRRYYLKADRSDIPVRANEWICGKLAHAVGILTPRFECVSASNGDILFGSEEIVGVKSAFDTRRLLHAPSQNELGAPLNELRGILSAIHAFDLFVNNIDRHEGNFLIRAEGAESKVYAFDFARSLFFRWPFEGFITSGETTSETWLRLRERHGFDLTAALAIVDRLGIVKPDQLNIIMSGMPRHWLSQARREELLAYCANGGWVARVAALHQGLKDGSII